METETITIKKSSMVTKIKKLIANIKCLIGSVNIDFESKLFIFIYFVSLVALFNIVPHFQSPDSGHHILRAYSLVHGDILSDGKMQVNKGLLEYIDSYSGVPFNYDVKVTTDKVNLSKNIRFGETTAEGYFPNTALYFPASYIPQAIALFIGEEFHLKVHTTIVLARIFCIATILLLLLASFSLYKAPIPLYFVMLMPITLFQSVSATTDGIHFSLVIFIASIFLNIYEKGFNGFKLSLLFFSIIVIITHRINLLPLVFLPLALYFKYKRTVCIYTFVGSIALLLLWLLFAMLTIKIKNSEGMLPIAMYYIAHPLDTIKVFINTFSNNTLRNFYLESFVGQLGWLDYKVSGGLLHSTPIIIVLSVLATFSKPTFARSLLFYIGIVSVFLTYFILLVQWNKFPCTTIIEGVQGRYFIPIVILGIYAFSKQKLDKSEIVKNINLILLLIMVFFFLWSLNRTIIATVLRYFG